jgi:hypothetical protein
MTARVWDVDTWECLHVLEGHTGTQLIYYVSRKPLGKAYYRLRSCHTRQFLLQLATQFWT